MKVVVSAATAALVGMALSSTPSMSADLSLPVDTPLPVATGLAQWNWSGVYIGAHGGGGFADVDAGPGSLSGPAGTGTSFDADGYFVGGMAGVNVQTGRFVFGIEADAGFGSVDGNNDPITVPNLDIDSLATLRARAGVAFDRILIFGTGGVGVAWADSTETHPLIPGPGSSTDGTSGVHTGLVAGLGVEYAITPNAVVRGEYLHGFFDDERYRFPLDAVHTHDLDFDIDLIRGAVIWRFGR